MPVNRISLIVLICAMCAVIECNDTPFTREKRTFSFVFPSPGTLRNLWSSGVLWELPKASAIGLLKLVSTPDSRKNLVFNFRPEDGKRASYAYQQRYGYRGQWLIELIGSGYHPDSLLFQQPSLSLVLTPPPPPL